MSIFVEVNSKDKQCPVIINLDSVCEIAPLSAGGSAIFFNDSAGSGSRSSMTVENDYSQFKQFVMQTVSAEDIARKFPKVSKPVEKPVDREVNEMVETGEQPKKAGK